jgi:hypothetical protein
MKTILLSSVAALVFATGAAVAAVPAVDLQDVLQMQDNGMVLHVKDGGNSGSGGGGNSGSGSSGHGGGDDDGDDDGDSGNDGGGDDGTPDQGGGNDDDGDNDVSGSGRSKPRVPGGSGCDDPGDVAEHPECSQ